MSDAGSLSWKKGVTTHGSAWPTRYGIDVKTTRAFSGFVQLPHPGVGHLDVGAERLSGEQR